MIIKNSNINPNQAYELPDHFVSEEKKKGKDWMKNTMDYYWNIANMKFRDNTNTFVNNYNLVKGILKPEDFYIEQPELRPLADNLLDSAPLPAHVKHYSILTPPLYSLLGEMSKRPDNVRFKAYDEDSKNEELQFKTEIFHQLLIENARTKIMTHLAMQGQTSLSEEEIDQITAERIKDELIDYTSEAEKWANKMHTGLKMAFNIKELSEDAFRDLLIAAREYIHIYENNSKEGLGIEVLNPKNVWTLSSPNKKYVSDTTGNNNGCYAAGTIEVMEISEIIERFQLTKKEIDHLRDKSADGVTPKYPSNFRSNKTGEETITYNTYYEGEYEEKLAMEASLLQNGDPLGEFLGITAPQAFNKFTVVQAYFLSKKKIGKLTYIDEEGNIQETLIDESYTEIPNEVEVEWGYVNQWYKGIKVGDDIYYVQPFELLDYCPIIGVEYEKKNTTPQSLIDLMKPLQVLYNICMNQLYELLEKEKGVVYKMHIRRIPVPKDGDHQDAIAIWEEEAMRRGVIFEDETPEQARVAGNTNVSGAVDLSRTAEIQSRYNLVQIIKIECWELVGITRQRLGGTTGATETATATQAGLNQSYAQTEPYFQQHEYVMLQVYQAMIDAAQHIAIRNPTSTISYISSEGEQVFMQVNREDLSMRDLRIFATSRGADIKIFEQIQALAQPMLQNGAHPADVVNMYTTNSLRQLKKIVNDLKEEHQKLLEQQQQMEQAQLQQQQQALQAQLQAQAAENDKAMANENMNKELDRISEEKRTMIMASGRNNNVEESDSSFDPIAVTSLINDRDKARREYELKLREIAERQSTLAEQSKLKREELQVKREDIEAKKWIAKENKNKGEK